MIQDIPSPEMYLSRLPEGRCGGWNLYQDLIASTPTDINFHDLRECSVFWAITVPGESQWHVERLEGTLFKQGNACSPRTPSHFNRVVTVPKIPSRVPYLTSYRHKLPDPQSADFGILLKARSPTRHAWLFSSFLSDIRRRPDQRPQAHDYRYFCGDPRFRIVSRPETPLNLPPH